MAENRIKEPGRWQLRHAAGSYWLLDMLQGPESRKPPFSMNQAGAEIWGFLQQGMREEAVAEQLSSRYQIERERALADVRGFVAGLEAQGVVIVKD
ncbi:MAG: PqqD family protein [Butyrivibrio sp.]|nr:PqqD family protein [Acetatifactor muris]MCM1559249.1 PqqD family protein [Butyrivibrio sp.]